MTVTELIAHLTRAVEKGHGDAPVVFQSSYTFLGSTPIYVNPSRIILKHLGTNLLEDEETEGYRVEIQ